MKPKTHALFVVVNKHSDESVGFNMTASAAEAFVARYGVHDYAIVQQDSLTNRWAFGGGGHVVGCGDRKSALAYARILARRAGEKTPRTYRQLTVREDYARIGRHDDVALASAVSTDRLRRASGMK